MRVNIKPRQQQLVRHGDPPPGFCPQTEDTELAHWACPYRGERRARAQITWLCPQGKFLTQILRKEKTTETFTPASPSPHHGA